VGQVNTAASKCLFAAVCPALVGNAFTGLIDNAIEARMVSQCFKLIDHLNPPTQRTNGVGGLSAEYRQ